MEQVTQPSAYQVYISHRGPDTKRTLASLIYHRLRRGGLRVFLDVQELGEGHNILDQIQKAIESASVYIAIFSEHYAESSFCLDDLSRILVSMRKGEGFLIPVYYNVEPSELRFIERGGYAEAFKKHQSKGKITMEVIENWKRALREASSISGPQFRSNESDLGVLLEDIAAAVFKRTDPWGWSKGIEKNVTVSMEEVTELKPLPHEVFISHSAPDTGRTLASLIHRRLTSGGLRVFLDREELGAGDNFADVIREAIESASVYIAIFSEHYAESRWCLDEAFHILASVEKGGRILIPVFYEVEAGDLRFIERGCYAKAFESHQRTGKISMEVIENWKMALQKVTDFSEFEFRSNQSDLGELLELSVEAVFKGLDTLGWSRGIEKNVTKEERVGELEGIEKKVLKRIQWENVSEELMPEQLEVAAQVFINHRVADVKHTLASHVYYSLANCYGLRVFMDEEQIRTENYPSPAILTAIRSASVHIVFFSQNYAELPRCLNELCLVLESPHQHTVIPVFCDVEPDDLRDIDNGRYAEAFKAYELKRRNTIKGEASKEAQGKGADQVTMEVEEWKEALGKAADIVPCYRFKTKESDYGEILEKIEENVLKELRWEPVEVHPHVFISHRGPNLEMSLASLMYNRLKICGFLGFHDNKELQTADTLSPATLGAIRSASLHITIFSEGYAESRQCLDELSSILKSCHENGSSIIPVFCGVKPPDLLNIEGGCYAQAFDKHQREDGVSAESVEGWKMALREVSKLSGLLFQTDKSDYGEFLEIFVEVVLNKIKREEVEVAPQVFINHNGPNVKVTIASLIENRLKICGLRIFQDNKEIHTGDTLSNSIVSAIRTASIHIVIFSQGYAESRQCLDELSWIFRSSPGSKIIPVYCDVEPDDLHYIYRGCYSHAFKKHLLSDKVERKVVDTWENALRQASASSGLFFNSEREFLEEIVSNVLDGVEREPLEVATHPVGIDRAAQDFQNEIMNQSKSEASRIVKIAGVGGVGKSTLVKYIFNLRNSDFRKSCYLSTNREDVDMRCLQRQLLRDLLGIDEFIVNIREGKRILRGHLAGLQILLVLDGFDHIEPIDSLVDVDALGAGSLILLTARDRESSPKTLSYDVKPLNRRHAKELFCRHAFLQFKPLEGYEDLVEKFLEICGGLPLSLEVVGGLLAGNLDKTYWMLQLKMFSKRLPDQILDTLKASYQKLNKEEKEMYLDIGCFLAGEDIELAVRVLQGSGYTNVRGTLDSLRRKCLLDFESDVESSNDINYKYEHPDIVRLKMHNHLTGFARHIVREEFIEFSEHKPFRLSCSNDMNQILQLQDGSDFCRIRGIRIPKSQNPPQPMNHRSIRDIRFLVVEHPMDLSSFRMHGDLVWLRLDNFPSISIPSTISLANLRVLELHSPGHHGEQLFQAYDELPSELREFHPSAGSCSSASASRSRQLFDTLQNVMPSFSRFLQWTGTFMNKIVLKNMDTLESFPIDFAKLKNLRHLDLSGCIHLTELPNSFSQLLELQYLALRDCKNLYMPTDILGEISSLEYVDFKGCAQLVHLPEGIARQRSLRYLNLLCTPKLQLPINLELLNRLEQLRIGSPLLTELPHSGDHLMSLQVLVLIECWGLNNILPRDISGPNVKVLVIRDSPITNFGFEDQGTTLVSKGALKELSLRHTSISEIYIPEGVYPSLETVDLSENIGLTQVKGLPSTLTRLSLQGCREMKSLTNLSNLVNLKFLNINGCLGLETLNIEGLISLEEIKAEGCWKLEKIRGLSQRERLNCLKISTDNSVIWNDICKFLTLRRSYGKLSIASFSGTTDVKTVLDDREIRWTMEKFNVKMVDIVSAATTTAGFHVKLDNFRSHGAILMCFVTSGVSPGLFRVRFEASNYGGPTEEYTNLRGRGGGGKCVHVFMWTEDSHLFRDSKDYSDIDVYCSHVDASEMDATHVERGWMVLVDKDTDFSRVCKEFIVTVTKNMFR